MPPLYGDRDHDAAPPTSEGPPQRRALPLQAYSVHGQVTTAHASISRGTVVDAKASATLVKGARVTLVLKRPRPLEPGRYVRSQTSPRRTMP